MALITSGIVVLSPLQIQKMRKAAGMMAEVSHGLQQLQSLLRTLLQL